MRIVVDTNVFVSGVFFSGPPYRILAAWRDGKMNLVVSPAILAEYERVGSRLATQFPGVTLEPFLTLLRRHGEIVQASPLPQAVCDDPDDDKFLACALAARCKLIVSGDKHLLRMSGYKGIAVLRPRAFVEAHLEG